MNDTVQAVPLDANALMASVAQLAEQRDVSPHHMMRGLVWHYERAVDLGATSAAALAAQRLGWVCAHQGRVADATRWARESLDASRRIPDLAAELEARSLLGACAAMRGDVEYAREVFESALKVASVAELRHVRAKLLVNLALSWGLTDDAERYESLTREAIVLFRSVGDRPRLANALVNRGGALTHLKRYEEARSCYTEAAELTRELEDGRERALAIGGLAEIDAAMGRREAARTRYLEARAGLIERGGRFDAARLAMLIGRRLLEAGDPVGCLEVVAPEIAQLEDAELPTILADLLDVGSQAHEALGDEKLALAMLRKRVGISSSSASSVRRRAVTPMMLDDASSSAERARACELVAANRALREALVREQAEKRRLSLVATLDPLTAVLNRRGVHDLLHAEFERSVAQRLDMAVLSLDVDHFKTINDTFGHGFGDEVLIDLARRVRGCVRALDLLGRVGGEEFLIVLPESDAPHAAAVANRIRASVDGSPFTALDNTADVTVSIGVAGRAEGDDIGTLLARADNALYEAKRAGRNRVITAGRYAEA